MYRRSPLGWSLIGWAHTNIMTDLKYSVIILCMYRPSFHCSTSRQAGNMKYYHEIRLLHLSPTDAQSMVSPSENKTPFPSSCRCLSGTRRRAIPSTWRKSSTRWLNGHSRSRKWLLEAYQSPYEKDIPSTVQGVISARLDRLERETKRILQEASVIGRAFLYEILKRISD